MDPTFIDQIHFLRTSGREAEILPTLAKYMTANPQDAQGWYMLSQYVPQTERKLECLERALKLQPDMVDAQLAKMQLMAPPPPEKTTDALPEMLIVADEPRPTAKVTLVKEIPVEKPAPKPQPVVKPATPQPKKVEFKSNPAGQSTQKMATYYNGQLKIDKIFLIFTVLMSIFAFVIIVFGKKNIYTYIASAFLVGEIIYAFSEAHKARKNDLAAKKAYASGAAGEMKVGTFLDSLGDDYVIWHDVPGKYGNFDHIVLSKKGQIFLIETKTISGTVTIKGKQILINGKLPEKDYLGQCLNDIKDLASKIKMVTNKNFWITTIIAFNAYVVNPTTINHIYVTYSKELVSYIQRTARWERGTPDLWAKAEKLNEMFGQENLTYEEFQRKHFERISSLGRN
jgi:hypothetical protein